MAERPSASRQKAYRRGHRGEWLAAAALMLKGYRILSRRHRTRFGEIDLIARRGDLVLFVEVKARRTSRFGAPGSPACYRTRFAATARRRHIARDRPARIRARSEAPRQPVQNLYVAPAIP